MVGIKPRPAPPLSAYDIQLVLLRHDTGARLQLPLEEYVKGVVAAEMPAEFQGEALKAQALLARTYAVKRLRQFGGPGLEKDAEADLSSDPASGQAWIDQAGMRRKWGLLNYYRYWPKISAAVEATRGLIVTYQGEVADALYHSTCGGHTEAAADVWGQAVPYLTGVPCPYCTSSPHYHSEVAIPVRQLAQRLGVAGDALPALSTKGAEAVRTLAQTAAGRVKEIKIGNLTMKGTDLRARIGLPSTWFTWQVDGDRIRFDVRGWGHGVGMCQYGAEGMAKEGRSFSDIIRYYLPGTEIKNVFSE